MNFCDEVDFCNTYHQNLLLFAILWYFFVFDQSQAPLAWSAMKAIVEVTDFKNVIFGKIQPALFEVAKVGFWNFIKTSAISKRAGRIFQQIHFCNFLLSLVKMHYNVWSQNNLRPIFLIRFLKYIGKVKYSVISCSILLA